MLEGDDLSEDVRELDPRGRRGERRRTRPRREFDEEWDLDALVQQMQALYGTDITVDELQEEVELDARGADRGVRRGRARDVRREGAGVRRRS